MHRIANALTLLAVVGVLMIPLQKQAPPAVRTLPGQAATAPPRVVCGMTVIPVNPDVDSKMRIEPRGGDVDYKVRSLTSPMCR